MAQTSWAVDPEEVGKIYVTPDLTLKEQKESKALRSQLAEINIRTEKSLDKNGKIATEGKLDLSPCTNCTLGKINNFKINCMSTNARKFSEFQVFVDNYAPRLIAITESWCSNSISNAEINLEGYTLYSHHRKNSVGGGVLLYVHESLPTVMCESLMNCQIDDFLWYVTTLPNKSKLLIGVVHTVGHLHLMKPMIVNWSIFLATCATFRIALICL